MIGTLGWPWVFWVNVPFGLISIVAGWLVLPVTPQQSASQTFDWRGALLLAPALTLAVFALNQVSALGLASPVLLGSVGGAIVLFFLFVRQESKTVAAGRSCAAQGACVFRRRVWRARFPTPCFTACSSWLRSRSCAATKTAPL